MSGQEGDILRARRAVLGATFTDVQAVMELNTPDWEAPSWLSIDGCRLYFDRGPHLSRDMFVAERAP